MEIEDAYKINWVSVGAFVFQQDMVAVLSKIVKYSSVVPPTFVPVDKELATGRSGFYMGCVLQTTKAEAIRSLQYVTQDLTVND